MDLFLIFQCEGCEIELVGNDGTKKCCQNLGYFLREKKNELTFIENKFFSRDCKGTGLGHIGIIAHVLHVTNSG